MNANAKSFVPFQTPRPSSPVAENSFYYPPLHGFSSGVGVNTHIFVASCFFSLFRSLDCR